MAADPSSLGIEGEKLPEVSAASFGSQNRQPQHGTPR
jgi:hypothetical protein